VEHTRMEAARRYASRGQNSVSGWLAVTAARTIVTLADVQEHLGIEGAACEIGVYHGRLFILLCTLLRTEERALGIDLFEQATDSEYGSPTRAHVFASLARHGIAPERVCLMACDSMTLRASDVKSAVGAVRLFSVDGGHTAENAAHDLDIAAGSVCEGGLVILDDFFNPQWPGVAEGTCRFMAKTPGALSPVAIAGSRFIFARGDAEPYRRALTGRESTVFGQRVITVPEPTMRTRLKSTALWRELRSRPIGHIARRALQWLS
jgi:hypothetical protein